MGAPDASPRPAWGPGSGNLLPPFSALERSAGLMSADGPYIKPGPPLANDAFLGSAFASRRPSADSSAGGSTVMGGSSPLLPGLHELRLPEHRGRALANIISGLPAALGRTHSLPAPVASPWSGSESASAWPAISASSTATTPPPSRASPGPRATRGPTRVVKKKGKQSSTASRAAAATASGTDGVVGREQRRDAKNETEKVRRADGTAWLREMQVRLEKLQWTGSLLSQANHRKSKGLLKYNKLEIMHAFVNQFDEYRRQVEACTCGGEEDV
jgi:hypothetical protein